MELNHLRYFYEVAREGSFTRASKRLRVSQPSISKMVKQLEERHEVKLLDRGGRSVTLTQTGRRFYEACDAIFREVGSLEHFLESSSEECVGDLLVGASDNLCNYVLPRQLMALTTRHPNVNVKLLAGTSEDIKTALLSGRCDLGLFYTPVAETLFVQEKLGFVPFALVSRKPALFSELGSMICIGSRALDYTRPYPALRMLETLGLKPRRFFETNSQETQKRMALAGHGYTLVPEHMVSAELASGKLHPVKFPPRAPKKLGTNLILCHRRGRSLPRPAVELASQLRAAFSERVS